MARPSAQGQAMIRTATVLSSARLKAGAGPATNHTTNVMARQPQDGRNEVPGDDIRQTLDWGPRALSLGHQTDDPGQHGVGTDPGRPEGQRARRVERGADDEVVDVLLHRQALAGDHALIYARGAVDHDAVDRDGLARSHPNLVADPDLADRQVDLAPSRRIRAMRGCRPIRRRIASEV